MQFYTDFDFFTEKIRSGKPFAYARYADGEVALMRGAGVGYQSQAYMVDNWSALHGSELVGKELLVSLSHQEDNYYYAISAINDNIEDYTFLMSHINTKNITFANLWINANYQKMKSFYSTITRPVYLICNQNARPENFPFNVAEIFPFPDDCIRFWETHGDDYTLQLIDYISQLNDQTIFISAGPISEILIHKMYVANPNNQYIDVGSSLDEYVHQRKTRPYMDMNSIYATQISYFENQND